MNFSTELEYARMLDEQDELAPLRQAFVIADPELIYLDGNSLGRLPKATNQRMRELVEREWGDHLIRSWNDGWIAAPGRVGGKIAGLLGARPDEVIVADSTSVNLYKLVLAALRSQPSRRKIVTDDLNFPSDLYILQGICRLLGQSHHIEVIPSPDGIHGPEQALAAAIDEETALVTLSHTTFKSGFTYDMQAITNLAHRAGAIMLWDLSHSAGAVPVHLNDARVDLAVGCTYKYLNGGPGSPAFLYVRQDWQEKWRNPISGWMGQKDAFDFNLEYEPAPGLLRFLSGTPPVLALSAIEPGVDLLLEVGMDRVRAKSIRQSEYLIAMWETLLAPLSYRLNSPREAHRRGSHLSLGHDEGFRIVQTLINDLHVLPDFRRPDNIRLGIAPLYTSFSDLHAAATRLKAIVAERLYERYSMDGLPVT